MDQLTEADCGDGVAFLIEQGWEALSHGSTTLATHCLGVGWVLTALDGSPLLVTAGLLHPAYGAESYPGFRPIVDRSILATRFGAELEDLVYLYSRVSEESLGTAALMHNPHVLIDRDDGRPLTLTRRQSVDLASLFFANLAEQYLREGAPGNALGEQAARLEPVVRGLAAMAGTQAQSRLPAIYGQHGDAQGLARHPEAGHHRHVRPMALTSRSWLNSFQPTRSAQA